MVLNFLPGKYYKAILYGLDNSFTITCDNLKKDIFEQKKFYYEIIVKKTITGYREIITGKKISSVYIQNINSVFDYETTISVPSSPIFIIDDKEIGGNNIIEANEADIAVYVSKNKYKKFLMLSSFEKLERLSNNNIEVARVKYELDKISGLAKYRR